MHTHKNSANRAGDSVLLQPFHVEANALLTIGALHRCGFHGTTTPCGIHKRIDGAEGYQAQRGAFFFVDKRPFKDNFVAFAVSGTITFQHHYAHRMILHKTPLPL